MELKCKNLKINTIGYMGHLAYKFPNLACSITDVESSKG